MKKFIFILCTIVSMFVMSSCTENVRAKKYGGTYTIKLDPGYKLVEATWKEASLWYLVEPMDSTDTPKTKIFKEDSSLGIIEGKVIFVETR